MIIKKLNRSRYVYKIPAVFSLIISFLFLQGCIGNTDDISERVSFRLEVTGDVENPVYRLDPEMLLNAGDVIYKQNKIKGYPLSYIIKKAEPRSDSYHIMYISHDGVSAVISGRNLDECYLVPGETGWNALNPKHPASSNIKDIEKIIIITDADKLHADNAFCITDPAGKTEYISPGQIYREGYCIYPLARGVSAFNYNDGKIEAVSFYCHKRIDIYKYLDNPGKEQLAVFGENGESEIFDENGFFILKENSIGYAGDGTLLIPSCRGIIMDPPEKSITDVYKDARSAMLNGERLLIILIDGFGFHQYLHAGQKGYIPFLASLPEPERSMSAYPPITPVNLAASLTGEPPSVNGIHDRKTDLLKVPTIFGFCMQNEKSCQAIIGPVAAVKLEIEPIYCLDLNNDESTDDEKAEKAMQEIKKDHDLIFVHFKDADKTGHKYGDYDENTMQALKKIDGFTKNILSGWSGKVLIYADHGMHPKDEGGTHGSLIAKDMFTPYWLFYQGGDNE